MVQNNTSYKIRVNMSAKKERVNVMHTKNMSLQIVASSGIRHNCLHADIIIVFIRAAKDNGLSLTVRKKQLYKIVHNGRNAEKTSASRWETYRVAGKQ